jgi:hypothetical protein
MHKYGTAKETEQMLKNGFQATAQNKKKFAENLPANPKFHQTDANF